MHSSPRTVMQQVVQSNSKMIIKYPNISIELNPDEIKMLGDMASLAKEHLAYGGNHWTIPHQERLERFINEIWSRFYDGGPKLGR